MIFRMFLRFFHEGFFSLLQHFAPEKLPFNLPKTKRRSALVSSPNLLATIFKGQTVKLRGVVFLFPPKKILFQIAMPESCCHFFGRGSSPSTLLITVDGSGINFAPVEVLVVLFHYQTSQLVASISEPSTVSLVFSPNFEKRLKTRKYA